MPSQPRGPNTLDKYHRETERNLCAVFRRAADCSPSRAQQQAGQVHTHREKQAQVAQVFVIARTRKVCVHSFYM